MTLLSKKNISKFAFAAALTTMPFLAAQADTPWTPQQWANQSQKYAIVQCLNNQGEYSDWWVRKWTVDVAPSDVKIFIGLPKNIVMQLDFQNPNGSAAKLVTGQITPDGVVTSVTPDKMTPPQPNAVTDAQQARACVTSVTGKSYSVAPTP
ncbi:MAG: hypothetical protein WCD70_03585 [Alphaproteobacteria bacterium]